MPSLFLHSPTTWNTDTSSPGWTPMDISLVTCWNSVLVVDKLQLCSNVPDAPIFTSKSFITLNPTSPDTVALELPPLDVDLEEDIPLVMMTFLVAFSVGCLFITFCKKTSCGKTWLYVHSHFYCIFFGVSSLPCYLFLLPWLPCPKIVRQIEWRKGGSERGQTPINLKRFEHIS